jgi:hypothetical protein
MLATCPVHLILIDLIVLIIFRKECKLCLFIVPLYSSHWEVKL